MTKEQQKRISKFLSLILRHRPEVIGITLDEGGWANTFELLEKMNDKGYRISQEELKELVEENDKRRFSFSSDNRQIRACQGHTIKVDLGLEERVPPPVLYHGTSRRYLPSILQKGIGKGERHHVHLSRDTGTALQVGSRHGNPVVLKIQAGEMYEHGIKFYISENEVWLTNHVPPEYIEQK